MTRLLVLVALVALTCSVAMADGTDPVFKLSGGGSSNVLTSDTFTFTVDPGQEFTCGADVCVSLDFINFTGAPVTQLNLNAPAGFTFSCDPSTDPYFNNCSPQTATPGPTTISFFGIDATHPGILSAGSVTCGDEDDADGPDDDSDDTNCTADNGSASDFDITIDLGVKGAITTPFSVDGALVPAAEPGTLVLVFAAGLGFLALKRSGLAA
ncbi:MAG TPA: hypothetical protein VK805_16465 [Candidatus Baltobacteraceae bacterium]|jgi:hypothetical protein|nr:hypothetical protein [Candidatus Baltobacteraceae bacterium]